MANANNACTVMCDTCGITDKSGIPGKKHRRCGGSNDAAKLEKHNRTKEGQKKGTWEKV